MELPFTSQILELAGKVFEGKYTLEYAQKVAAQPEFFVELLYPVVYSTCESAEKTVRQNWRPAVNLLRIVLAALAPAPIAAAAGLLLRDPRLL